MVAYMTKRSETLPWVFATIPSSLKTAGWLLSAVGCWMLTATLQGQTFAERLGWSPQQVVVILHVDDVGMSHSSNLGAIQSIEQGVANSWAVMMPCPWVSEIAQYLKEHPQVDSGLYLTLTSE